jgi:hypothetical protein
MIHIMQIFNYELVGSGRDFVGNPERDHYEDLDTDGRITLKRILEKDDGCINWVHLAQDRDQWQTLANTVKSLWVP